MPLAIRSTVATAQTRPSATDRIGVIGRLQNQVAGGLQVRCNHGVRGDQISRQVVNLQGLRVQALQRDALAHVIDNAPLLRMGAAA